jgi:hypothetical protein
VCGLGIGLSASRHRGARGWRGRQEASDDTTSPTQRIHTTNNTSHDHSGARAPRGAAENGQPKRATLAAARCPSTPLWHTTCITVEWGGASTLGRFQCETAQIHTRSLTVVRGFLQEGTADAARPPDPRATRGSAQRCKGDQETPMTCMRITNHKATSPATTTPCHKAGMSAHV